MGQLTREFSMDLDFRMVLLLWRRSLHEHIGYESFIAMASSSV